MVDARVPLAMLLARTDRSQPQVQRLPRRRTRRVKHRLRVEVEFDGD